MEEIWWIYELIVDNLSKEITELVIKSREKLKDEMNNEQIKCYWDIGRKIIEEEQKGKNKAEYGKGLLINLSKKLKNWIRKRLFSNEFTKYETFLSILSKMARRLANYHGHIIVNW